MSGRRHVEALLKELGEMTGLEDIELEEGEYCCMVFDGIIEVELFYDDECKRIILSCNLGSMVENNRERLLELLLHVNYFWKEIGVVMSQVRETGHIIQLQGLPIDGLAFTAFKDAVDSFLKIANEWKLLIKQPVNWQEPEQESLDPSIIGMRV